MAHFAKINKKNVVVDMLIIDNKLINNTEFPESEPIGQEFIKSMGINGVWLQTSYNRNFRKNYAGIGYTYDGDLDIFIGPKPYESWMFDKKLLEWVAPVPMPTPNSHEEVYIWNEKEQTWNLERLESNSESLYKVYKSSKVETKISVYQGNPDKKLP